MEEKLELLRYLLRCTITLIKDLGIQSPVNSLGDAPKLISPGPWPGLKKGPNSDEAKLITFHTLRRSTTTTENYDRSSLHAPIL